MRRPRRSFAGVVAALLAGAALQLAPSSAGARPSARALYSVPVLRQMVVSPSGAYLASVVTKQGRDQVVLRRRDETREIVAFKRLGGIGRISWIAEGHLVISVGTGPTYHVVSVSMRDGELVAEEQPIRARGRLVGGLATMGEEVLWAVRAGGDTSVYRLPISDLLEDTGASFVEDGSRRVARLKGRIFWWVADRDGTVRAALKRGRGSQQSLLWHRDAADADWRVILEAEDLDEIALPYGIAENGNDLVVASRAGRDTWALFELSPQTGQLGRELFARPDADVVDVIRDYSTGEVIGAVYERDGLPRFHHLDSFFDRYQRSLAHALPNTIPAIVSVSRDRRYFVVVASSPRDPGTYYVLDTETNTATRMGRTMPWLDPEDLADVEAIRVASTEAIEVEAFLTRPNTTARRPPLVVLPHGGPIFVRDRRVFDPLVQFLAAGGLAVLQVNYRGSAGRGQAFQEAAKGGWGTGIEDDLEAAVDEVVGRGLVDADRVCIAGVSYGGYSALISVIRSPERYRCAASLNGPTDLLYDYQFYLSWFEEGREYFEQYIGDPDDQEQLRSISPAYRAAEIRVPVLLVQGTEDRRVDVDHYYRMLNVLEALHKPHEAHLIRGGGHNLSRSEWVEFAIRLRRFLSRHLKPG